MGRSFSASHGKNAVQSVTNAVIQARQLRSAVLSAFVQGEGVRTASLNALTSLFTQYELTAALNAVVSTSTLIDGLQRYYKLDGNGVDSFGGQNAVVSNPTYVAGKIGQAARIAGDTSKSIVAPGLNLMTAISISMWVYWTGSNTFAMVVGNMDGAGGTALNYAILTSGTGMTFYGTGNATSASTAAMTQNVWHHVVATRTLAGVAQFWVNGVAGSTASGPAPFSVPAADFRIGHREDNYASFPGDIDEVAVWDRVLTADEIEELYNKGVGQQHPFGSIAPTTTGLLGYWKFDGNSADSLGVANGTDTAITYSAGNGKIVQGAGFNGTTSQIDAGSSLPLDSNNWSLAVWMNPTAATGRFLTYYGSGPTLQWSGGNVALVHGSTLDWNPGIPVSTGVWTHLVMTRQNTQIIVYKNGIQHAINSAFSASFTKDTTVRFGNSPFTNEPLNGALDEIGIWNRRLTATEAAALYNAGAGIQYPF